MQRKRARLSNDNEILDGVVDDDDDDARFDQGLDNDQQPDNEVSNPLVVPLEEEMPTQEEILQRWFTQDVFTEPDEEDKNTVKFDNDDEMEKKTTVPLALIPSKKPSNVEEEGEMEIVPTVATDSDSDEDEDEDEDIDEDDIETKGNVLALAKKMVRKRRREEMLDDVYNKRMLPEWFVNEEKKHSQPMKPITKEEANAEKARFKEIDARPAKKVAQAKARKKRATHRKLEKIRKKANTISDMEDVCDRSKGRMIEQLYKKATTTTTTPQKAKKEYVVAKKGVQVKASKGEVLVDRRMKSDTRTRELNQHAKGKKGRKG